MDNCSVSHLTCGTRWGMSLVCAVSLLTSGAAFAVVRHEAAPETLASAIDNPNGETFELTLRPGVYDLPKILGRRSGSAWLSMRLRAGARLRVAGAADDPAKVVLVGDATDIRAVGVNGPLDVEGVTFRGFRTTGSGAALALKPGDRVNNCRFENCTASENGGAVAVNSAFTGVVTISNCTFVANRAENGAGGGLFVQADPRGKTRVVNCVFRDNVAARRAPAAKRDLQFGWDSFPQKGCAVAEEGCVYAGASEGCAPKDRPATVAVRPGDDLIAVRDRIRASGKPAEVVFGDGVYEMTRTLVLDERDSGTVWRAKNPGKTLMVGGWNFRGKDMTTDAAKPILARLDPAARDKVVSISVPADLRTNFTGRALLGGCPAMMGLFGNYNGFRANNLGWSARYPTYPVFSVDADYMYPAQWPNGEDYYAFQKKDGTLVREGSAKAKADTVVRVTDGRSDRWRLEDADILASGFLRGCEYSTERALVTSCVTGTVAFAQREAKAWGRVRFVNVMEELDAPGEWCYDKRTGLLVLYPPAGFRADSVCALGTLADSFFRVYGSDIDIEGFVFTAKHSHPAVCVEGGERVRIRGCRFSGLEYWACYVSGRHNEVRSCDFTGLPADGLFLCGGNTSTGERGDNLIENCHAWNYGFLRTSWQRGGIYMKGCGNTMRHCQADSSQEVGFGYGGVDHLVEYCRTHTVSFWNGDSGAVYTPGGIEESYGCVFRYNDLSSSPGYVNGLYCDDCGSGHVIYGNIIRNFGYGGIFIGGGRDCEVYNNLVISPTGHGMHLDVRGLAWKQLKPPAAISNCLSVLRRQWNPESSPVAKKYPRLAHWFDDPMRVRAPFDDHWHDNVVIDCGRSARVITGADLIKPDFRLVSERNLHIRTRGGAEADIPWMLGGFKTINGTTNAPIDVGFIDLPKTETTFGGRKYAWRKGDLTLKDDSIVYRELPNFKPIPFVNIGLYKDEWRKEIK